MLQDKLTRNEIAPNLIQRHHLVTCPQNRQTLKLEGTITNRRRPSTSTGASPSPRLSGVVAWKRQTSWNARAWMGGASWASSGLPEYLVWTRQPLPSKRGNSWLAEAVKLQVHGDLVPQCLLSSPDQKISNLQPRSTKIVWKTGSRSKRMQPWTQELLLYHKHFQF